MLYWLHTTIDLYTYPWDPLCNIATALTPIQPIDLYTTAPPCAMVVSHHQCMTPSHIHKHVTRHPCVRHATRHRYTHTPQYVTPELVTTQWRATVSHLASFCWDKNYFSYRLFWIWLVILSMPLSHNVCFFPLETGSFRCDFAWSGVNIVHSILLSA